MSYCHEHRHHATPDALAGRCQECELVALRERIKAYGEAVAADIYGLLVQHFGSNLRGAEQKLHEALSAVVNVQRERAEKAEWERGEAMAILNAVATVLVGDDVSDFEQSFPSVRGVLNLREALAEAREDIKALAEVVSIWRAGFGLNLEGSAWQRIRDRKLLEVSDGE